jgi:hypothetical protein
MTAEAYHLPVSEAEARALLRVLISHAQTSAECAALNDRLARLIEPGARPVRDEVQTILNDLEWQPDGRRLPDGNIAATLIYGDPWCWVVKATFPDMEARDRLEPVIDMAVAEYLAANPSFGASFT